MKEIEEILKLDRTVHEPARLAILAVLSTVESVDFKFLQHTLGLTQGNLSAHISKLERAGFIRVKKAFIGKRVRTELYLPEEGVAAFGREVGALRKFVKLLET